MHRCQDVICEVVDYLIVNVMFDLQEIVGKAVGGGDGVVPDVFGSLDCLGCGVEVAFCVEVEVWNEISAVCRGREGGKYRLCGILRFLDGFGMLRRRMSRGAFTKLVLSIECIEDLSNLMYVGKYPKMLLNAISL